MRIAFRVVLPLPLLCLLATPGHAQPTPAAAPREPVHKAAPVVSPPTTVHAQKPAEKGGGHRPAEAKGAAKTGEHKAADARKQEHKAADGKPVQKGAPKAAAAPVPAAEPPAPAGKTAEKLPEPEKPENGSAKLPRFASLRADEVNMRAGPGARYRIEWVYKRRDLPVEIEREFDVWRYVRDPDGIQGWMQHATLMGRRTFIVQHNDATLRAEPKDAAAAVAVLKPGVIGRIRSCDGASDWCNVSTGSYRGWLRREQFWGTLPNEAVAP